MIYVKGECLLGPRHPTDPQQTLKLLMDSYNSSDNYSKKFSRKEVKVISEDISAGSTSSQLTNRRRLYIMQNEFATVDHDKIDFVGTDTAVSTIGLIIRNRRSGMISIAHMDSPSHVENGLGQMVDSFETDYRTDDYMDVYMIGAVEYDDYPVISNSYNLTTAIVQVLKNRRENFSIQLLQVLRNNTRRQSDFGKPIFHGFMMDTSNGSVIPARFDSSSRIPNENLRRIRNMVYSWSTRDGENDQLFNVYRNDKFVIDPFDWRRDNISYRRIKDFVANPTTGALNHILNSYSQTRKAEDNDFESYMHRAFIYWVLNEIKGFFPRDNQLEYKV